MRERCGALWGRLTNRIGSAKVRKDTMKAIIYTEYGTPNNLQLREVTKPDPGDDEVLIEVQAVGLNAADRLLLAGKPFLLRLMTGGLRRPRYPTLGADVAGRVAAVGRSVTTFRPGDELFGDLSGCGWGGLAEFVCAREEALVAKPHNLSFAEAAAIPMAAVTALQGLRTAGNIQAGQSVLIHGASGGVGSYAVQLGRAFGAEVTAVCGPRHVERARTLGAGHVMDYTQEDFARNGPRYDLLLVANGDRPLGAYLSALRPGGICVVSGGALPQLFQAMLLGPWHARSRGKRLATVSSQPNKADLTLVKELVEAGKVVPLVERCYPLAESADAFRALGEGHARGKVVVALAA